MTAATEDTKAAPTKRGPKNKAKDQAQTQADVKPNPVANERAQALLRAGRRSSNANAGKPLDEGMDTIPTGKETPAPVTGFEEGGAVADAKEAAKTAGYEEGGEAAPEGHAEGGEVAPEGRADGGEAGADAGGIVAAAEAEKAEMLGGEAEQAEGAHNESAEGGEGESKTAIEQFAAEEAQEPQHQTKYKPVGEYQAPEGESHAELKTKYHQALAFGDTEEADRLYDQLQEHRYHENAHRGKLEHEAEDYTGVAQELAQKYPVLAEDGIESDKVLALAEIYRNNGEHAAEALRHAVADLFGKGEAASAPAAAAEAAPETPAPAAAAEAAPETPAPAAETKPEEGFEMGGNVVQLPDTAARALKKREIASVPAASARNEPEPPPKVDTRSAAIDRIKAARNQK